VLSLARTRQADLEAALRSVDKAKRPGIHIFIATSELHLKRKLMMTHQEVIDAACWAVRFAKQAPRLRRVLRRGRVAQRARLSGAGLRRGHQGRRVHARTCRTPPATRCRRSSARCSPT
jgi:hypothetical protein